MDIKDFIKERVQKNHLSIDIDDCYNTIIKYREIYIGEDDLKLFFHYVLNKVGGILNSIDEGSAELFGMLKVRGKGDIKFYEFEFEEDYLEWQQARIDIYQKIDNVNDLRLLNFVELSTMNMISDVFTKCKYDLFNDKGKTIIFNKTGYGTDKGTESFIKFLGSKFKEGFTFKPMK